MRIRDNKGFTLVEVIVSMLIIGLLLISVVKIFSVMRNVNTEASNQDNAVNLSSTLIEIFRGLKYEDITKDKLKGTEVVGFGKISEENVEFSEDGEATIIQIKGLSDGSEKYKAVIKVTPEEKNTEGLVDIVDLNAPGVVLINDNFNFTEKDKEAIDEFVSRRVKKSSESSESNNSYYIDESDVPGCISRKLSIKTYRDINNNVDYIELKNVYKVENNGTDGAQYFSDVSEFTTKNNTKEITTRKLNKLYIVYEKPQSNYELAVSDVDISVNNEINDAATSKLYDLVVAYKTEEPRDEINLEFEKLDNSNIALYKTDGVNVDSRFLFRGLYNCLYKEHATYKGRLYSISIEVYNENDTKLYSKTSTSVLK